jgi:hypothetical protein
MGMQETQPEHLASRSPKQVANSMVEIVLDVSKASNAVVALTEMMQEYSVMKDKNRETVEHLEHGMWLCGELGNHQRILLERLETALHRAEVTGAPESLLADRPEFSDSLSLAARSVAPAAN